MPSFNVMMALIGKFVIVSLYSITTYKFYKSKKLDDSLRLRFNRRSMIELVVIGLLNIAAVIIPVNDSNVSKYSIFIFIMLLATTMHVRRIAAYGKKVIFILEHAFFAKDVTRPHYEKGLFTFEIKGRPFKLRFPLADTDLLIEKLQGRSPRKHK